MYTLNKLPKGKYLVEARFVGFAPQNAWAAIDGQSTQDFTLEPSSIEEQEVVITGNSHATTVNSSRNPLPK